MRRLPVLTDGYVESDLSQYSLPSLMWFFAYCISVARPLELSKREKSGVYL